jgi:hypothetical protein
MGLQVVLLSAPTSLSSIMAIGPHQAAVTRHVGDSTEVGQREHLVRQGFTGKCWSEFLCLGGYLAPPRQVAEWGGVPRGMRSVDTPPPIPAAGAPPAGTSVAGAQLGIEPLDHQANVISGLAASNLHDPRAFTASNMLQLSADDRTLSTLRT